jgi:nucleoside-diphosphate-sugar epimerase
MIILDFSRDDTPFTVAVFGVGAIGYGVVDAIRRRVAAASISMPFAWLDADVRAAQGRAIEALLRERLGQGRTVHVVWSAGRSGFLSNQEDVDVELRTFEEVLRTWRNLSAEGPFSVHLVSSAGGIFEGQRHVDRDSSPWPVRPYGRAKLQQERALESAIATAGRHVYRVTSAYGYIASRFRPGLVSRLILDGLRHDVSRIIGTTTTLRDFVFIPDVARFISDRILQNRNASGDVCFLIDGRPHSLLEVQHAVEETMRRKLHVAYSLDPSNGQDITFSAALAPAGWVSSELRTNVAAIHRDARQMAG